VELYQLKSFVAIAREQNLTRTAEQLCLSQSALSSQIKALEEELGLALFRRSSRGMLLTEHGEALLSYALGTLEAAREMRQKAAALSRGIGETVTIGLHVAPTFLRIGAINRRLSLLHTDLNVIFLTSRTVNTAELLRQRQIDLGFFYGDVSDADIQHTLIAQVDFCVVIPRELLKGLAAREWPDVAALPWVWAGGDSPPYAMLSDYFERRRLVPNQVVSSGDEHTVRELLLAGQGAAVMREEEALPLAEQGHVVIWEQGRMTLPLSLACLDKRHEEKRIRAVLETVRHIWQEPRDNIWGDLQDKCWV
jgi:DNA-binding transcriptional LysR family regulator